MHQKGMTAIRWFSSMNDFIDCLVFVPEQLKHTAFEAMTKARDDFWEYQFETYGDCVINAMNESGVPYTALFLPWDHETDGPEIDSDAWERMIAELPEVLNVV